MNFQELLQRMQELDQPMIEEPNEGNAFSGALDAARDAGQDEFEVDGQTYKVKEDDVEECGMGGMSMPPSPMKQQDNVSMNVSMNGSGAGGIRDLMAILKNIEDAGDDHDHDMQDPEIIVKKMMPSKMNPIMSQEEFANEPDEMYQGSEAVTGTGDDLHGNAARGEQGDRYDGYAPRGVPTMESLVNRLANLYQEVKTR